jgi:hypothetical protein
MALPPPKRGEIEAFYRVFGPVELSAAVGYTTQAATVFGLDVQLPHPIGRSPSSIFLAPEPYLLEVPHGLKVALVIVAKGPGQFILVDVAVGLHPNIATFPPVNEDVVGAQITKV